MTGIIVAVVVLAAVAVAAWLLVGRSATRRVRSEALGNPHPDVAEPLIRPESQHHDSPSGSDIRTKGGREHDED
jgi:hypothetical protein